MSDTAVSVDRGWKTQFPPLVVHFDLDNPASLPATNPEGNASTPYLELSLIVPPGTRVEFLGKLFLLERDGLHVLIEGCYRRRNVIVYKSDEIALFRALAQIQIHSEENDKNTHEEKIECAKRGALPISCGSVSTFTRTLVAEHGLRRWFARTFQMVAIRDEATGQKVWGEDDPERIRALLTLSPNATLTTKAEWRNLFYGKSDRSVRSD